MSLSPKNSINASGSFAESGAFDGIEANNIGQIAFFDYFKNDSAEFHAMQNEKSCKKHAPFSDGFIRIAGVGMNAMNSFTMKCLTELGYDYMMPSPELTGVQLASIPEHTALADRMLIGIHGRTPLMQLLHCPIKEHKGCANLHRELQVPSRMKREGFSRW